MTNGRQTEINQVTCPPSGRWQRVSYPTGWLKRTSFFIPKRVTLCYSGPFRPRLAAQPPGPPPCASPLFRPTRSSAISIATWRISPSGPTRPVRPAAPWPFSPNWRSAATRPRICWSGRPFWPTCTRPRVAWWPKPKGSGCSAAPSYSTPRPPANRCTTAPSSLKTARFSALPTNGCCPATMSLTRPATSSPAS